MDDNALVSVIVITYNSSAYVIDTLESIKNQTYRNIELIVSDDCSTDDTVTKVREWINDNDSLQRFKNITVVLAAQNAGVSKNCNQGYKNAQGKYLKYIAGDDVLLPNCIEDNMNFAINNPDASIIFSDIVPFGEDEKKINDIKNWVDGFQENFNLDTKMQFKKLIHGDFAPAPSSFMKKEFLVAMGGFDERFPMMEDWPLWIKATYNGIKLHYFKKETVLYRISNTSLSIAQEEFLVNPIFFKSNYDFFIKVRAKYMPWLEYWDNLLDMVVVKLVVVFGNKRGTLKRFRWVKLLKPSYYRRKIRKILKLT